MTGPSDGQVNPPTSAPQVLSYSLPEHLRARLAAKRRDVGIQVVGIALAVGCFAGAALLVSPLNTIRKERQLMIDPETLGRLPPDIALLGKLGTFRALAIDWASIRAERLKEEGKTYEALQLHQTICRLAPRFPTVWVNAAWNMAYNISVMKYTPEERWQWVQNGIKLLRDEGMRYNPKAVALYKELVFIYWHKIGDILDDEHRNYKRALAVEMERVLGPPPITLTDEEYFDWFRKIVEAPHDLRQLLATSPETARLAASLQQVGLPCDDILLEFVARNLRPELQAADLLADKPSLEPQLARQLELVTDPEQAETLDGLLAALRSQVLRERYKFDLESMMSLMEDKYGPLDWRNAFTHALYWSSRGIEISRGHENLAFADKMNTSRFVFFALQAMITQGKMVLWPDFDDPFSSYIDLLPDTRLIPYLYDTYLRLSEEHFSDDQDFVEGLPARHFRTGFVTNMHNWIEILYLEGGEKNLELAEAYYAWLRENNTHPDGTPQSRYLRTLDDFVMGDILTQLHTSRAASGLIRSFVRRALKGLSLGRQGSALTSLKRARLCWNYWEKGTDKFLGDRIHLQPMRVILRDQIEVFMTSPEVHPLFKTRLWRELPLPQRQMTYGRLRTYFARVCAAQQPPWAPEVAFSEPPGMDEFRATEQKTRGAPRRAGIEEGERYKQ